MRSSLIRLWTVSLSKTIALYTIFNCFIQWDTIAEGLQDKVSVWSTTSSVNEDESWTVNALNVEFSQIRTTNFAMSNVVVPIEDKMRR